MVAVSEAGKVPPACDGNLVGHLCSFCLLRRDLTLRPIEVLYEAVLGAIWASPATKCDIAGSICAILLRRCHMIY
mgnify:CR=1 FL=1